MADMWIWMDALHRGAAKAKQKQRQSAKSKGQKQKVVRMTRRADNVNNPLNGVENGCFKLTVQ